MSTLIGVFAGSAYHSRPFMARANRGGMLDDWLLEYWASILTGLVKPILGLGVGDSGWRLSGATVADDLAAWSSLPG